MSLKCDVTGSTDRVEKLPEYMQTEDVKYVCFKVAVKMEKERLAAKEDHKPETKPMPETEENSEEKPAQKVKKAAKKKK